MHPASSSASSLRGALRGIGLAALLACAGPAGPAQAATPPAITTSAGWLREIATCEDRRDWAGGLLAKALEQSDVSVRRRAILAVGRLQDSTSVPALLPLLGDRVAAVRQDAAFALGQIGHRSARQALERALDDGDVQVRENAVEALGKLGDPAATPNIVRILQRGTPVQRLRACESLWRLADTSATGALLAELMQKDPALRWRVAYALEKLPLPGRVVPAVSPLLSDPDPLVRAHAARTLGREKSPLATPALLAALTDADPAVVVNVLRSLQLVADGSRPGTGRRIAEQLRHRDPYVRVTAATALADSFAWVGSGADSSALLNALRQGMQDSDFATRGACGRALIVRLRLAGLELARPLFADSVAYTRVAVLDGLRQMRTEDLAQEPPRVVNALSGAYFNGGHLLVRMTAAEVSGALMGRTHSPELAKLLEPLRAGVTDQNVLLSAAASGALADAGDTASVPLLARAYATRGHDADADARIGIRDALRALAGRAYADSVERAHPAPAAPLSFTDEFFAKPAMHRAILHTSAGDMEWRFEGDAAPQTVKNFVKLAQKGYFDSLRVHRAVPDFVIQDGDPTGTGSGGPGYSIRCEYNELRYEAGMVGMALSGKDTGGSQWFVTLSPQPHLNGRYTIFARVTRGLDVAKRITQGATVYRVEVLP
jgi:cyclophilin family peptidyl-prolyl cis-trans isomerase/HEAT repeat protein